jgi:hypothetical protein
MNYNFNAGFMLSVERLFRSREAAAATVGCFTSYSSCSLQLVTWLLVTFSMFAICKAREMERSVGIKIQHHEKFINNFADSLALL